MNLTINQKANQLARQFRQEHGSEYEGGLVIVFKDQVGGWMNELRDPQTWEPGCIAVDLEGNQWVATGGNAYDGATHWEALATSDDEESILSDDTLEQLAGIIGEIDERFQPEMDNDLKPCPFCNGKARFVQGTGTKPYTIQCISCLVETDESNSAELLKDEWNHRIPTEREAPCQHFCEQAAFNIEIRKLRRLLGEAHKRLAQNDQYIAAHDHKKFMSEIEIALGR